MKTVSVYLATRFRSLLPEHPIVVQSTPQLWLQVFDLRKNRFSKPFFAIENFLKDHRNNGYESEGKVRCSVLSRTR
jgi:hypothetical protein